VTEDAARERFAAVPIARALGMRLDAQSSGEAAVSMDAREDLLQDEGVVQGGVVSALADAAAVHALYPGLPDGVTMTSIEFKINFLRPALPGRGPLVARARVVQRGRRVGLADVEVSQSDRLVAKGLFTYLFFDRVNGER
jgi:uncharacterized protein (TIGR00369 family)